MSVENYGLFIDGKWRPGSEGESFEAVNPYTRQAWATHAQASPADVADAVEAAHAAFAGTWRRTSGLRRATLLHELASLVERDVDRLALLETTDNGKVIRETRAQVLGAARQLRFYAGYADKVWGSSIPLDRPDVLDYTHREPIGVAALVTAWNSPLSLLSNKLAPALAAGNCVVIKPSEHASATTAELCRLVEEAGFPPGVVNMVTGDSRVGKALVDGRRIGRVSFTGSPEVGREIAAAAGRNLVPVTLELGGKSANIVFQDADLPRALVGAVAGIFAAGGQSCVAGSRLLVHRSIHDQVVEELRTRAERIVLGDPADAATEMGCVANEPQLSKILTMIEGAEQSGARLVTGGRRASGPGLEQGFFVQPTIFTDVTPDMPLAQEEVFGPVLAVLPFDDEDEAIAIANNSRYGLAAAVWTRDVDRAVRCTRALDVGTVWVNCYRAAGVQAPSGGVKDSGFGRERGEEALDDYLTVKNVMIDYSGSTGDPFVIKT
ncbi:aldehyde dehydrogenase [Microbispora sp. H13382]|uniref:aldehyde dehydrogenase n=1 Tax=Microbispora sp. H13382 TaxID=2729112 RepID=UPI001601ED13|nr:aldehyde dehydrogenase [Microbispora sp. H13382]